MNLSLILVRSFRTAKARLRPSIGEQSREVAREMFERVIGVVSRVRECEGIVVATDGVDVAGAARRFGADVVFDQDGPLAMIADRGLVQLAERGATKAIVMMADVPMVTEREVGRLWAGLESAELVLAPDRGLMGTNAIAVRLPAPIATRFGHADSFPRHLTASGSVRVAVVNEPGLAFDVDQPADLDEWRRIEMRGWNENRVSRVSAR